MKLTRRRFVKGAAMSASLLLDRLSPVGKIHSASPSLAHPKTSRPNIIFILADDLGWGDLSCYGRPDYRTPNIDLLASQGAKFTDAYSASALCTHSRCGFITGRYPARLKIGLTEPLSVTNNLVGLDPGHPTIASQLKQSGYDTALFGKWHLGFRPEWGPNAHGFDEFFGILSGAADYFTHKAADAGGPAGPPGGVPDLWENLTPIDRAGYLTDLLTDKAVEIIGRRHTKPFFLSLQYTAPHSPWEGPQDAAIEHNDHGPGPMVGGGSRAIYGAMMKSMDAGIGRVLKTLARAKLERDTLVIFTSDNGGERYSYNWPFSSAKGDLWEGGTRVPAIVRWPGVIPAGQVTDQAAITMDWTATILAATGTAPDRAYPLDGEDLMPLCTGKKAVTDRSLFWRVAQYDAARMGRWKYLKESGREHLFDLSSDPGEKADVRTKHADVFARIRQEYAAWNAQVLPRLS